MPRGKRISPAERRSWLEQYDQGSRIDKIAREAGRTQRTVNEHIARARQERQQQEVTTGLLTQAYHQHYAQLLELAEALGQASERAHPDGILDNAGLEKKMLYRALRTHIPRARLWSGIKAWEESSKELHRESRSRRSNIECRVRKDATAWPEILAEGFADSLWNAALMTAEGRDSSLVEYRVDSSGDSLQLRWGSYILADGVATQKRLDQIRKRHQTLAQEMISPKSILPLAQLVNRWQVARDTIQEEVVILRLRRILPGQCDLCPGGEGPSSRHTSRSRRNDE